jgi:hypothetical protein
MKIVIFTLEIIESISRSIANKSYNIVHDHYVKNIKDK